MNADGSGKLPLTVNTDEDNNAAFSPDGRKIVFASDRGTGFYDIYVMDANGGNPVRITFATSGTTENFGPDWSPDGQRIAFMSERDGGNNDREVFTMNPDGSGQTQLTTNSVQDRAPKFSPDGKLIIWSQELGTTPNTNQDDAELFTMPAAGGTATRLTTNTVADRAGAYTRDGLARIFFVRRDVVPGDELYVMNGNGSSPVLFAGSPSDDIAPAPEPIASCQKKKATIIGTSASETLVGGPGPDVFSGQGGKDKIKGKGGKDTICGDAGKDNLNGGPGKDLLVGGKGNDKEIGGKGKDTCIGGKGTDSAKGCEKEKSL
jgi:Ca2+-binding RTX toxin-like protein